MLLHWALLLHLIQISRCLTKQEIRDRFSFYMREIRNEIGFLVNATDGYVDRMLGEATVGKREIDHSKDILFRIIDSHHSEEVGPEVIEICSTTAKIQLNASQQQMHSFIDRETLKTIEIYQRYYKEATEAVGPASQSIQSLVDGCEQTTENGPEDELFGCLSEAVKGLDHQLNPVRNEVRTFAYDGIAGSERIRRISAEYGDMFVSTFDQHLGDFLECVGSGKKE